MTIRSLIAYFDSFLGVCPSVNPHGHAEQNDYLPPNVRSKTKSSRQNKDFSSCYSIQLLPKPSGYYCISLQPGRANPK